MTEKALDDAFTGESMVHIKYLVFSDVTEEEGYKNIARVFRAIAERKKCKNALCGMDKKQT